MRRLIDHLTRTRAAHRENGERGAVAVLTALTLVVLLGFAAIAIDVGAVYAERAELQTGADAVALGVAQECALGRPCTPDDTRVWAQTLAEANVRDGSIRLDQLDVAGSTVTATTHTADSNGVGTLALSFAPVLGIDDPEITATSTAQWFFPKKGKAVLPIIFSRCELDLSGTLQVLEMHDGKNTETSYPGGCTIPGLNGGSGLNLPGGFGTITSTDGQCSSTVDIGQRAASNPGNNIYTTCKDLLEKSIGSTVLLPIYRNLGGTGSGGWYEVDGWAAFELTGYRFPGIAMNNTEPGATCTSPCTGIIGRFVRFASLDDTFTSGGPDYGAAVVGLSG